MHYSAFDDCHLHSAPFNHTIFVMYLLWAIFLSIVIIGLATDIFVICSKRPKVHSRVANYSIFLWLVYAVAFGVLILVTIGRNHALQFLTGYFVEMSLSIDNLFVFMSMFTCANIHGKAAQKALIFGIIGSVIFRSIFLCLGIALLDRFKWMTYVFGVVLLISAAVILRSKKRNNFSLFQKLKNFFKIKDPKNDMDFFTNENGKIYVTSLFVCACSVVISDIIFASDSIPAILSISNEMLIAVSSSVFAVIGLRMYYVLLAKLVTRLVFFKYGIAINLAFIGFKMLLDDFYKISTVASVLVIVSIIVGSIILSLIVDHSKRSKNISKIS